MHLPLSRLTLGPCRPSSPDHTWPGAPREPSRPSAAHHTWHNARPEFRDALASALQCDHLDLDETQLDLALGDRTELTTDGVRELIVSGR